MVLRDEVVVVVDSVVVTVSVFFDFGSKDTGMTVGALGSVDDVLEVVSEFVSVGNTPVALESADKVDVLESEEFAVAVLSTKGADCMFVVLSAVVISGVIAVEFASVTFVSTIVARNTLFPFTDELLEPTLTTATERKSSASTRAVDDFKDYLRL